MKPSNGVCIVIIGLCALLVGQWAFADAGLGQKKTLMLFPFAIPAATAPNQSDAVAQFSRDLVSLIGEGLAANRAYSVIKFEPRIASIQRAVKEQKVEEKDVLAAIDTDPAGSARAQTLANLTGSQLAMSGSIDKFIYSAGNTDPGQPAAPGQVEIGATVLLIDANTGKELYRFVSSAQASAVATESQLENRTLNIELTIGTDATYALAEKLLSDINKSTIEMTAAASQDEVAPPVVVTAPRKSDKGLIPAMIGAALIGLLISGGK